ncbi:gamma-glutamyl-gamma-aminobutyrate hydrolase family protein [Ferruginibacter sp.]|uniref:gamma-glutamyl-gamma-aminobutyrate hydrolase family protein n=1 Tax=Ferruginibacter sp. TaxID=1940288 RepID=UPI0019B0975F|nr:gamma-glutamyl-gamma-aminobutyrate hydrolase family protein [Ferruginibacter sp.]MBC7626783.1 gamma-glutamyl-gamma-aminobutyrate hydrolase family protein [Ferruginibacter sp.]
MKSVIKIGVTYTGSDEKHSNYLHWLKGNDAIEITTLSPLNTDLYAIKDFDGIVLSGGVDMHPEFYKNDVINYPNAPLHFDKKRDEFEMALFKITQQYQLPLLGVCRGMQLINCVLGGTLTQDIGATANAIHRFEEHDKAHGIHIVKGTLLSEITGVDRTITNSAHHQCIDVLGEGLTINCGSDDGIIEGVEWTEKENKSFFLAIQWHPERMYKFHLNNLPAAKNIRDRFLKEIKISIENKQASQVK